MRKLLLSLALFLFASAFGFAQEWVGVNRSTPVRIQESLVSSSEDEIVIDVKVGGFYSETVKTPQGEQILVSGEGMAEMLIKGAPNLPMYPISMIIGDRAEMKVSVIKSNYVDFENIEVAPSKGNFSRQINPNDVEYVYGEMYQQDAFYPSQQAVLESPYILRDFRGQNVMVYPYAYNPVTKTLRVYTDLRLSVKKVSDNGENQKVTRRSNVVSLNSERAASYERRFINYNNQSKYEFLVDEGEMLIVCVDQYMDALQDLVNWKNISGRPTSMVAVSETGTQDQLKTYIQNYYAENPDLAYILLVGEHNNLPGKQMTGGRSDNFYGMLDGDDYYEEVFVGRLSVNSVEDAAHQVSKIIHYERDIDETATWITRAVGIGADEGAGHYGEPDYVHMNYIRDTLMHYTYTEMSQHYNYVNNPTAANMRADFNQGASIANYCNHGSPDSWAVADFSNADVHQLTNDNKLPFIWSVACNNGEYQYDECFAEAWMRAKNLTTNQPTGAIGGMFSWISQPWVPPMYGQDEMNAILTEWRPGYKHTLGGASVNGNQYVLDMSPEDAGSTHNTWILFGDPSLMVRTDVPKSMNVIASPSTLLIGMTSLIVSADTDFGIATLSREGEVLASAYVENGTAHLEFPQLESVADLQLVVIGYNKVTEVINVSVIPAEGAFLIYDSHDINQTDGQVDCAEDIILSLNIKNVGEDPTSNVSVELSSESEYVTITDSSAAIASIAGNEVVALENEFAFTVAPNVPDQTTIEFVVTATDGTETWETSFNIKANAPVIKFKEFLYAGSYTSGESQTVAVKFENKGHYQATNAVIKATAINNYVTIENDTYEVGTIDPNGVGTAVFNIAIDAECPETDVIEIVFTLTADNDVLAEGTGIMKNSCLIDFVLEDIYGDGWNSSTLTLEFDNGDPIYTINFNDGYTYTETIEIGVGVKVTVKFNKNENFWTDECSYIIKYKDGEEIYNSNGEPMLGVNTEFVVNCGGGAGEMYESVQNLEAVVDANQVTLTWVASADSYIIERNGIQIAETEETTYVDSELANGTYTYSVTAVYENGQSMPVSVNVEIGVGFDEYESVMFAVYPNPAKDVINISTNAVRYDYQLINGLGQVVLSGTSDGTHQINVSNINKGVYFLKVVADGETKINKLAIQ